MTPLRHDARSATRRHSLTVRITHWVNVLCIIFLLPSGLQIFNAHPALYLGEISDFDNPVLAISAEPAPNADGLRGFVTLGDVSFTTTGLLGASKGPSDTLQQRAFPSWSTLPGDNNLAEGRRWHFFFAWLFVLNGAIYLIHGLASRHAFRNLAPTLTDLKRIGADIRDHLRLRFHPDNGKYGPLQKLAYFGIAFLVLPVIVVSGWAMSPGMNAAFPWMVDIFGGRQSARTMHFVAAFLLVLFIVVHLAMVVLTGPLRGLRAMVTGGQTKGAANVE
ncbi:MAG: hypothetical protein EA385_09270 [Salinarimonadaceae bacterium]|nr:MAG: hypothetical protein EA385_09270 [Salinarimonadaceae bacterium]